MSSSDYRQEIESLNGQIEQLELEVVAFEDEKRVVDTELDSYAIEEQNIGLLQQACTALEQLQALGGGKLFWGDLDGKIDTAGHAEKVLRHVSAFENKTRKLKVRQVELTDSIAQRQEVLSYLQDEVKQAHIREEHRRDQFVVSREFVPIVTGTPIMPWSKNDESDRRLRNAMLIALFWCLLFGVSIPLINLPITAREPAELKIPPRMAMLLKEEAPPPKPAVIKEAPQPKKPEAVKEAKTEQPKKAEKPKTKLAKKAVQPKPQGGGGKTARKKQTKVGVLAFKSSFDDLMDEVPVASLKKAKASRGNARVPGAARASRSLVSMQASGGGSSGIGNFGTSRNLGNGGQGGGSGYGNAGQIGGVGTQQVASSLAGLKETGRPLSAGADASRTDEEIQIVFDRYKATLYRIYNKELRKDPTLKGRITLKLTIEPDGVVSMCLSESSDLGSATLIKKIVARVKRFNFGAKEDVPAVTIRYPIDFLPAG